MGLLEGVVESEGDFVATHAKAEVGGVEVGFHAEEAGVRHEGNTGEA